MYLGFDAQARYKNLYLFGEACRSYNGSIAFIAGCSLYPDQRSGITVIYRNYPPGFINWFGNAFGQNSLNANENGVYITAGSTFGPGISVSGYLDLFAFPWLKYRVDTPTEGQEYGITASWSVTKQCEAGFSFYRKNIRMNAPTGPNSHLHELIDNFTDNFKFNVVWNPRDNLNLKTRIQIKRTGNSQVKQPLGFLLYEEMQFKPRKILAGITLRIGLFDIPDYNSRIYVYEPDVYYGYSVPFFEGTGMRACMVLTAVPIKNITIWFRGGLTIYTDRAFVGSGNDMTEGNTREDVSVQLRFRI
jgi:hypothetical protein